MPESASEDREGEDDDELERTRVDDKGCSLCKRGIDTLQRLRTSAVIGAVSSIFMVAYHIPPSFLALHSIARQDEVVQHSCFNSGICGPQVDLACPGPTTPIARPATPRSDMAGRFRPQQP